MAIWKFLPVAKADDPEWASYAYRRPLLVEAHNIPEAKLKARQWYKEKFQGTREGALNHFYPSAFEDDNIYQMVKLPQDVVYTEQQHYPLAQ